VDSPFSKGRLKELFEIMGEKRTRILNLLGYIYFPSFAKRG